MLSQFFAQFHMRRLANMRAIHILLMVAAFTSLMTVYQLFTFINVQLLATKHVEHSSKDLGPQQWLVTLTTKQTYAQGEYLKQIIATLNEYPIRSISHYLPIDSLIAEHHVPQRITQPISLYGHQYRLEDGSFIDLSYKDQFFPVISSEQVLEGFLHESLVANKDLVLVLSSQNQMDAQLQLLAQSGKTIKPVNVWVALVLVMTLAITMSVLFYFIKLYHLRIAAFIATLVMLLAWLVLNGFSLLLPWFELLLVIALIGLAFRQRQHFSELQTIKRILRHSLSSLHQDQQFQTHGQLQHYWQSVNQFLSQTLMLNRSILLAKMPNDHRTYDIAAFNYEFADIVEQRRDFYREPYESAMAQRSVLALSGRLFFKPIEGDQQYLMPLRVSDEVVGFWAFSMAHKDQHQMSEFEQTIGDFAEQISNYLNHHRIELEHQQQQSNVVNRWLELQNLPEDYSRLANVMQRYQSRLDTFERIFNKLDAGIVLFDVYGHIMFANEEANRLANLRNLPLYELGSEQLLMSLTGQNQRQTRELFQRLVLEKEQLHLPILQQRTDTKEQLNLIPLHLDELANEIAVFDIKGLMFEWIDVHRININQRLYSDYEMHLTQMARTLQQSSGAHAAHLLQQTLRELSKIATMSLRPNEAIAVFMPTLLAQVIKSIEPVIEEFAVTVAIKDESQVGWVIAQIEGLQKMLEYILVLLAKDSQVNQQVLVTLMHFKPLKQLTMVMKNEGYGALDFSQDRGLQRIAEQVKNLGGTLHMNANLGQGSELHLSLPLHGPTLGTYHLHHA